MIKRWRQILDRRYQQWITRRLPPIKKIRLDNRKLFIFPTRAGVVFLGLLVLLWLMATNFENNVVFAFTFLLAALFIIAVFHTFLNLSGLHIEGARASPGFAGQTAEFEYLLSQTGQRQRYSIEFSHPGVEPTVVSLTGGEVTSIYLAIPVNRRGWCQARRIRVHSVYPLGLLKVWTYLQFNSSALVYPQAIDTALPAQGAAGLGDKAPPENYMANNSGSEDFVGLEKYRLGESLRHIAWKQFAREQGLLTKHYADAIDDELWLDWELLPGLDSEARLSRLCAWTLGFSENQQPYGLRLPGVELAPGTGRAHRDAVLRELALFEQPKVAAGPV
ncbi:hypothetical protein A9Q89_06910 [Gammaproteobacteria bacterium 53_120_T64]|nr:hypothetical protein A9Q89_06910 [Gammaproteobacteria bacterium 53_120_T64]